MQTLLSVLQEHGINLAPDFSIEYQRNDHQWLFVKLMTIGSKTFHWASFGDFKLHNKLYWFGGDLSPEEMVEAKAKANEHQAEYKRKKEAGYPSVAEEAKRFIQHSCTPHGVTPYMVQKQVTELHGAYRYNDMVIAPLQDIDSNIWSYQTIFASGVKQYLKGGKKRGCFFAFNPTDDFKPGEMIYVCEGYSTGASIFEALHKRSTVVAALDAGNLKEVGRALRSRYPDATLYFCADNDQYGANGNTGIDAANEAIREIGSGCELRYPVFTDLTTKPTDFNDLHLLLGLDEVTKQLNEPREEASTPILEGAAPTPKPVKKSIEYLIASSILNYYGDNICKQKKDVFIFNGTYWDHMDQIDGENFFKNMIEANTKNTLSIKQIGEVWKRLLMLIPSVPKGKNMFEPNPHAQNFKNGTLHLIPKPDGSFDLDFKDFNRADYLIYQHPFAYEENAPLNEEFEASLNRVWANDPDIETKKKAYFEVLGASLVPAFRKVVLFVGPPASGKSTLILFAVSMVHQSMRSTVDPTDFSGFSLESMAGKLLNYDTDITLTKTLSDSVLKKVEDRIAIRVKRKNQIDVASVIPGIHLFGANRMPISSDGPGAYKRRMLIFKCSTFEAKGSAYTQDFAVHVWAKNPQGIVRRAIEGLKAVCANRGHFTIPESSSVQMEEWKNAHFDPVEEFLMQLRMNEVEFSNQNDQVKVKESGQISAKILWKLFLDWFELCHPKARGPGRTLFFRRLKELGIKEGRTTLERYYHGFSVDVAPNAMV